MTAENHDVGRFCRTDLVPLFGGAIANKVGAFVGDVLVGEIVTHAPTHMDRMHAWAEAFELWLDSRRSENTRRAYRGSWAAFLAFADKLPWEIHKADVARWMDELRKQGLSKSTLQVRVAAISSFYLYARDEYEVVNLDGTISPLHDSNPAAAKSLRVKVNPYGKARYLSTMEARALLRAIPRNTVQGLRDYALFLFYLATGRRNSEVRTLKWEAFEGAGDGERQFGERQAGERVWYRWSGKGKSDKRYECPLPVWQAIHAYLKAAGRLEGIRSDEFIFTALSDHAARLPNVNGETWRPGLTPLSMREVARLLKRYARLGGLDPGKIKVHTLRHTAAMLRKESGASLEEICQFLCHSSLAVTQIYLHEVEGKKDTCWSRVEALLGL